ncbi:MAG: N-(5'-phosphoribosyl)anthranilate isomerase [Aureispira sp.]|nr:N-(5'-phosphoribosyl)anthranilate isomerase [Aureispira sp.]
MLKTNIKASQISNLTDARYFAAWGTEWLGFCFDFGQDHYIAHQEVKAIKEWIVGPKIVGEFGAGQTIQEVQKYIDLLGLDLVQVGPFADLDFIQQLSVPVIKAYYLEDTKHLSELAKPMLLLQNDVEYSILDFTKNNISWTAIQADEEALENLKQLCSHNLIMLHINMKDADEMEDIRTSLRIHGFSLQGGEEEKVGYKSFDELDDLFEALEP